MVLKLIAKYMSILYTQLFRRSFTTFIVGSSSDPCARLSAARCCVEVSI